MVMGAAGVAVPGVLANPENVANVGDHEIPHVGGVRDHVIPHPAIT
jgi:hypothetical protein